MEAISRAKRIVIKIGTSTLTHKTGNINIRRMEALVRVISDLKNSGREIILVSSGAIGVGVGKLGLSKKPSDMPSKQACAAVGQCELMYLYDDMFSSYNYNVAQVLLTTDIINDKEGVKNVTNTFEKLLEFNTIPIVNENDTVAVEEIVVGDNDTLSALVASLLKADLLVLLTDIDGLYDKDPRKEKDAKLIPVVNDIDEYIYSVAKGAGSELGTGGMLTKINAGEIALNNGMKMVIVNGDNPNILYDLFDGKKVGTLFERK